jgi:uncharacterized repeat protein (TIGR03803 family)
MVLAGGRLALLGATAALVTGLCLCAAAQAVPKYKVLHYFNGVDGSGPWGGVMLDKKGNVYGATADGGIMQGCNGYGCGLVFELRPRKNGTWTEHVVYSFRGAPSDGAVSYGNLALDAAGRLYGTTYAGGIYDYGTVFELIPGSGGWKEKVLFDFDGDDGYHPTAGPIADAAGSLYGTAEVVFELTPGSNRWTETVLHSFTKEVDGDAPYAGLIPDASGDFYGTTRFGGNGYGVVFELTPRPRGGWKETLLHTFEKQWTRRSYAGMGSLGLGSLRGPLRHNGPRRDQYLLRGLWHGFQT